MSGSLQFSYNKPTPIDSDLEIRAIIKEIKCRNIVVDIRSILMGEVCVTGELIAIQVPDDFGR